MLLLFLLIPLDFSASTILVVTCLFYIVLTMWSVQQANDHAEQWDKLNSEQDPPAYGS
ncbi:hypothetical protein KDK_31000 [Dictyobacter kobayashii]|uniref:Uncharacterized protein n=1 Tax=Dictyobacter kobayashii TaxID=2014872 RepID=A0A402AJR7_9CHLR|nr:hypothetical protein KDK_31000 [Dictyobacter kobayashii]